jgi:hypothetical protein
MVPANCFQCLHYVIAGQPLASVNCQTLTTKVIDYRQNTESVACEQLVSHEVHTPTFIAASGFRKLLSDSTALMSPRRLGPHLQAFFDIQPINQLVVHLPAFSLQ